MNNVEQIICQHCDEPTGETITLMVVAAKRVYDVTVCPACHEIIGKAKPTEPTNKGWEGIITPPSPDFLNG